MKDVRILVVDDEELERVAIRADLQGVGCEVVVAEDGASGLALAQKSSFDVVLTDLRMPGMSGIDLLRKLREKDENAAVIVMTAYGSVDSAVEAMRYGAQDFISKPFSLEQLRFRMDRVLGCRAQARENEKLRQALSERYRFHNLVGRSSVMRKLFDHLEVIASSDSSVLIQGESGTGKEVVARSLHHHSPRRNGPFVCVSCAMLNRELLESELFGHERGAFTGALRRRRGRFELAHGGTVFLDDVDDIPVDLQVKLLRVLQERSFERVGAEDPIEVSVRVIAATKKDLRALVHEQAFREDLYYRLSVLPVHIPPLRDRREDIAVLAEHFLAQLGRRRAGDAEESGGGPACRTPPTPATPPRRMSPGFVRRLMSHDWPGNVRELENAIEHAVALGTGEEFVEADLPHTLREPPMPHLSEVLGGNESLGLEEILARVEGEIVAWALRRAEGNQSRAARLLGIPRTTLREKLPRNSDA